MLAMDITCVKYQSANITSLGVVQHKHSSSKLAHLILLQAINVHHNGAPLGSAQDNSGVPVELYKVYEL
jgi:hypothetical protein